MNKMILTLIGMAYLFANSLWAATAPKTIVINTDTAVESVNIKYPQGFADKQIDKAVAALIEKDKAAFAKPNPAQDNLPPGAPGKHGLYIDYKIMFQNKRALSLLFSQSVNERGAAHPNNTVQTLNFIDAKEVHLNDLFKENSNYLAKISQYALTALQKKSISDEQWLKNGTKATMDNYKNWYFTSKGLVIVFDTYQVAAYVYGPQKVIIPQSVIKEALHDDVVQALWGNE